MYTQIVNSEHPSSISSLTIFHKIKAKNSNQMILTYHATSNPSQWLADYTLTLQDLPKEIRTLHLNQNKLARCTAEEILCFLNAVPDTVKQINLGDNGFFMHKSPKEIDDFLSTLGKTSFKGNIHLDNNGESDLTRALCPLLSLARQSLGFDLAFYILSKLLMKPIRTTPEAFFRTQLKSIVCAQEPCRLSLIQQTYTAKGGSFFKTVSLWPLSASEKIAQLKKWSQKNPDGAASQTLSRFGL